MDNNNIKTHIAVKYSLIQFGEYIFFVSRIVWFFFYIDKNCAKDLLILSMNINTARCHCYPLILSSHIVIY